MQVAVQNPAPVVATFEVLAIPNPKLTKEQGRPIYDEQEVCRIRIPGNRQTVGVYPAHEVFKQAPDESGFVQPVTYAMEYNEAYLKFKAGEAQTVGGTPLEELTFLTLKNRLELKALSIHTAETLAGLDGQALKNLGMGGRDLKNKALAYLELAAGTRDSAKLNDALEQRDREIDELRAQIAALAAGQPVPAPTGAAPSPFEDFGEDDLKNWIKDADPAFKLDARWGREKLLASAEEVNARLKKTAA